MSFQAKFLILVVLLSAGCSRTELVYDNADWLAHRWASSLLDAGSAQREAWREPFRQTMATHRHRLLPEVIGLLRALEVEVEIGLRRDRLQCWADAADRVLRAHAQLAAPLAALVLLDVSDSQVDHMAAEFAERNRDYRGDYLSDDPEVRERLRLERYVERIEHWTGDLSTTQIRLVEQALRRIPDLAGEWLDYREQQQQRLLALLSTDPDRRDLQTFFEAWWVTLADRPPTLVRATTEARNGVIDLVTVLDGALSPEQRAHALDALRALRGQLEGFTDSDAPLLLARNQDTSCVDRSPVPD